MQAKRLTSTAQAIAKSSEGTASRFWQGHWTTMVWHTGWHYLIMSFGSILLPFASRNSFSDKA